MVNEDLRRRALEVWEKAYACQMRGDLDEAIRLYEESLAIFPTAEAHTFLGWTYSFQGRLGEAIAECHKAIAVDPDFGNPYNDIGVYLMQQGDLDGAIPWLEKAKTAPRYEHRQFPYMNLGRIYLRRGQWMEALREFEAGVRAAPRDPDIRKMLHELRAKLN
jgi:tetratricopeptide (TPR) repeat protein